MELVISMGLVGLLVLVLVTGNIFVQKVIANWSAGNRLYEEGEWILSRLSEYTHSCDSLYTVPESNRILFYFGPDSLECSLIDDKLLFGGKVFHHRDISVGSMSIKNWPFTKPENNHILNNENMALVCLYQIEVGLSYKGRSDVINTVTRNTKAFVSNICQSQ